MTDRTMIFHGGVPTDGDVKALREAFPAMKPGDVIEDARIAAVIRCSPRSSRFRTVCEAWTRRLLADGNVRIARERGVGFRVLTESERVSESTQWFRFGVRKVGRSVKLATAVRTEALPEHERKRADHARDLMTRVFDYAAGARKQIAAVMKPPESLPRGK